MRHLLTSLIVICILTTGLATAQNYTQKPWETRSNYGIFVNGDFNLHFADYKVLPGIPGCCPGYESGTGFGISGGLFYSFRLAEKWELGLRAVYSDLGGTLSKTEPMYVSGLDGKGVNGEFEHTIKSKLASVGIMPLAGFRMSDPLTLHFGLRAGYLMGKTIEQKEEIITPDFGVFTDTRKRTRNEYSGDLPGASAIEAAIVLGASYAIPLNKAFTWFLAPEVFFAYGITPVSSDLNWNIASLNGGISLRYAPRKIKPPKPPAIPPAPAPAPSYPPPPSMPVLDASILAFGVNPDGTESNVSQLRIEEFLSQKMHPLLNYVF